MFTLCGCGECRRLFELHPAFIFRVEAGDHLGIPVPDGFMMHYVVLKGFVSFLSQLFRHTVPIVPHMARDPLFHPIYTASHPLYEF
jgi:hypothetical protein